MSCRGFMNPQRAGVEQKLARRVTPHWRVGSTATILGKATTQENYVNPIDHSAPPGSGFYSCMALQPRLGLLSKRWNRNDIVDSASTVVIGRDLAVGGELLLEHELQPGSARNSRSS